MATSAYTRSCQQISTTSADAIDDPRIGHHPTVEDAEPDANATLYHQVGRVGPCDIAPEAHPSLPPLRKLILVSHTPERPG
jgi:hypothetical protein